MKTYYFDIKNTPRISEKISLCLGFFDGVHLGHQTLIQHAKRYGLKVGVMCFDKSPKTNYENSFVTPNDIKYHLFEQLGIDYLFVLKVNSELLITSPIEFINNCLKKINPCYLVCGDDFTYGKNKTGTIDLLKHYFLVDVCNLKTINGNKISTTLIKKCLMDGNLGYANLMMGRNYILFGVHESGFGKGRQLGFPTININIDNNCFIPRFGVYVCRFLNNGKWIYGLSNIGIHPSINCLTKPILEIHVFDDEIIYPKKSERLQVELLKFIRPEIKFENISMLQKQVLNDIEYAKQIILQQKTLH